MTKLLLGTIFLFLDYSLPFGNGVLGLLPDFVGYALLWFGAKELESDVDRFEDTRLYSLILLPVTGIIYVLDALGVTNLLGGVWSAGAAGSDDLRRTVCFVLSDFCD